MERQAWERQAAAVALVERQAWERQAGPGRERQARGQVVELAPSGGERQARAEVAVLSLSAAPSGDVASRNLPSPPWVSCGHIEKLGDFQNFSGINLKDQET